MPEDFGGRFGRPVKVVIVDDSRSIRSLIAAVLSRSPQIQVVGEAGDPYEARALIREVEPDVITLDVVMPRMSGLSFLEKIMRLRPMPVVMVSSRTTENSREAIEALELGAVDCVDRARLNDRDNPVDLVETVLMAANSNVTALVPRVSRSATDDPGFEWNGRSVVIGSSTGGVDALLNVIGALPANCAPTVIAQHMPKDFLTSFANRLDKYCAPRVVIAEDGVRTEPGHVYVAPGGDCHAALHPKDRRCLRLIRDVGEERYIPSVHVLFTSAAVFGDRMVGVMLTGMGSDGAEAMLKMRNAGAHTIVQNGETAVVDGMPRSARDIGAAAEIAPLSKIGARIVDATSRQNGVRSG